MDDLIIKNETEHWICKICNGQFHKNGIKNHIRGHLKLVKGIKGKERIKYIYTFGIVVLRRSPKSSNVGSIPTGCAKIIMKTKKYKR